MKFKKKVFSQQHSLSCACYCEDYKESAMVTIFISEIKKKMIHPLYITYTELPSNVLAL